MSAEHQLLSTYERVSSPKVSDRQSGLNDLRQILLNKHNVNTLNDKGFQNMYDMLFKCAILDKTGYIKGGKGQKAFGTRLSSCAAVLRMAVEAGVEVIKKKTMRTVYNHILETLPGEAGELCEPLSLDYLRALSAILGHAPHTEHLLPDEWIRLTEFCCRHLKSQLGLQEDDFDEDRESVLNTPGRVVLRVDSSMSTRMSNSQPGLRLSHEAEELVVCLQNLLSTTNAPVLEVLDVVCRTLLGFLSSQSTVSRAQQSAFCALNSVLNTTLTNSLSWTAKITDRVIPLISRLWDTKASTLKEEMTATLVFCLPGVRKRLEDPEDIRLQESIDRLLEILCSEYRNRPERDLLQLDDIMFQSLACSLETYCSGLSLQSMHLRQCSQETKLEQCWATLSIIAQLIASLDKAAFVGNEKRTRTSSRRNGSNEPPMKRRQATDTRFNEFMRSIRASTDNQGRRLLALQLIPFLCESGGIDIANYGSVIGDLFEACGDGNPTISSWAFTAIASCAYLKVAKEKEYAPTWYQLWKLCERTVTAPSTCRPTCHVMRVILDRGIVDYTSIASGVEAMVQAADLNGPAVLCDSSLRLLAQIMTKRTGMAPGMRTRTGEALFQWFISKWHPIESLEKTGGIILSDGRSHRPPTGDIINFLLACAGSPPFITGASRYIICGAIGHAHRTVSENFELQKFLLSLPQDHRLEFENDPGWSQIPHGKKSVSTGHQIIDFMNRQCNLVSEKWRAITSGQIQQVTENVVRNFVEFTLLSSLVSLTLTDGDARRLSATETRLHETLFGDLVTYVKGSHCQKKQAHGILVAVSQFLPRPSILFSSDYAAQPLPQILRALLGGIFESLDEKERTFDFDPGFSDDPMDLDDDFDTSRSDAQPGGVLVRETLRAECSEECFQASTMALLALCGSSARGLEPGDLCGDFISYLKDIHRRRLIMMAPVVVEFLKTAHGMLANGAAGELTGHLATQLLEGYEAERCDSSLSFCVDALSALVPRWLKDSPDGLVREYSRKVYDHCIRIGIEKQITSSTVRMRIISLLQHILGHDASFDSSEDQKKQPLQIVLKSLADQDIRVAYYVAERLPDLTSSYTTSEQMKILDTVEEILPQDPGWVEALAVRVYILSQLAFMNSSTVTRIVYRIFETGQVEVAEQYAAQSLLQVAKAFDLADQRVLFKLFSRNLIHTWTEFHELNTFPFRAFGYETLAELYNDAYPEIFAQLLVQQKYEAAQEVGQVLGKDFRQILHTALPVVAAYAYSWHVNQKAKKTEPHHSATVEARIRTWLGDDAYREKLNEDNRAIVAELLGLMLEEGTYDQLFVKETSLADAGHIMAEIKEYGYSKETPPQVLRPWYKVRIVLAAIDHLCSKLGVGRSALWTPNMLVFVVRQLFNSLHPARGPIHARGVIRKIRLLVCFAGAIAKRGYLLEMLIHGLKGYVIDPVCAADTIGLLKYLLVHGKAHLQKRPAFAISVLLAVVSAVQDLIQLQKSAAVQGSQSTETVVQLATEFRQWLADHFLRYDSELLQSHKDTFQAIVRSAMQFKGSGNAKPGTHESELLQLLLMDADRGRSTRYQLEPGNSPLLDVTSQKLAFSLYCRHFERPESSKDDIFGADPQSIRHALPVMKIAREYDVGDGFLLWAARVLGRFHAASGDLEQFLDEADLDKLGPLNVGKLYDIDKFARTGIMRQLRSLLLSGNSKFVGLSERALELVLFGESLIPRKHPHQAEEELPAEDGDAFSKHHILHTQPLSPEEFLRKVPRAADTPVDLWIRQVTSLACQIIPNSYLCGLPPVIMAVDGFAQEVFKYVVAVVVWYQFRWSPGVDLKQTLSLFFHDTLSDQLSETIAPHCSILLDCLLYLRQVPAPQCNEETKRLKDASTLVHHKNDLWLNIDYWAATQAAVICKKYRTALLFAETHMAHKQGQNGEEIPPDLLLEIFRNIDDPDLYYGVIQEPSLQSVLNKFDFERDGWKSLSFRGANLETNIRNGRTSGTDSFGIVESLGTLGMNGLSKSFLTDAADISFGEEANEKMFQSAWKLEQWDLPCPETHTGPSATVYRSLQKLNTTANIANVAEREDPAFLKVVKRLTSGPRTHDNIRDNIRTLGMLTEMEEMLQSVTRPDGIKHMYAILDSRYSWMNTGRYEEVEGLMNMRIVTMSSLAKKYQLQQTTRQLPKWPLYLEASFLTAWGKQARHHGIQQHALSAARQLGEVAETYKRLFKQDMGTSTIETAKVLWDIGQGTEAIRMLQVFEHEVYNTDRFKDISKPKLLARLGKWIAEARREKPDKIMSDYLGKAILELGNVDKGDDAGRVFHEFASFCDQQLQNPANVEDFERAKRLRDRKQAEVQEMEQLMESSSRYRQQYGQQHKKAVSWLNLDEAEFQRLKTIRDDLLERSIANYLKCLAACEKYDGDAVRFAALWLEHSSHERVNQAAASTLANVPSLKFVPLMNQLSSRLQNTQDTFQTQLMGLIFRICKEHPFHGIYQILALTRARSKDTTAESRQAAALRLSTELKGDKKSHRIFVSIEYSTGLFNKLAGAKLEKKSNRPVLLKDFFSGSRSVPRFEKEIPRLNLPPPTMKIDVRPDCDYSSVPVLEKLDPECTIASGISAPKILKCQAANGQQYRMLVKGGNDDLRQDAIMEQVFEQVSELLQKSRLTRQRHLKIRTYKVVPLTTTSGIIEFVPDTTPLHDWLIPAHHMYHPDDLTSSECRRMITAVQTRSPATRTKTFIQVCEKFRPVMHFFFLHKSMGPDQWFKKRTAYTRSTAAISILGHVLGLGDRHGHNILLDKQTGEVVHIDLGVAFEQGRILPVPEVVPFRLTRDIVAGFGITKTEGTFRRCCEFTLEVLRNEAYTIMTVLDVLRYDPLYNWSISPVRIKRMQENAYDPSGTEKPSVEGMGKRAEEDADADRALTVVARKLSKTLSVAAAVNELIQQASDERNLAVLYSGWGAYA